MVAHTVPRKQIVDVLGVFDESFRAEDRHLWYAKMTCKLSYYCIKYWCGICLPKLLSECAVPLRILIPFHVFQVKQDNSSYQVSAVTHSILSLAILQDSVLTRQMRCTVLPRDAMRIARSLLSTGIRPRSVRRLSVSLTEFHTFTLIHWFALLVMHRTFIPARRSKLNRSTQ